MFLFRLVRRLEAAEQSIAELRRAIDRPASGGAQEEKTPAFKLDDAKMQQGIANLMGFDPFDRKRGEP
jgi:hypothetical protein